jgi:hypothetical protein
MTDALGHQHTDARVRACPFHASGELDAEAEAALEARCVLKPPPPPPGSQAPPHAAGAADASGIIHTKLYTHRADVERENVLALAELSGDAVVFDAEDVAGAGGAPVASAAELATRLSACVPAPPRLRLKRGAQVMLLRSVAPAAGLVNGARGVVTGFDEAVRVPVHVPYYVFLAFPAVQRTPLR